MISKQTLKEWVLNYLQSKDIMAKNILSIEHNKDGFDLVVRSKAGDQFILIRPELHDAKELSSAKERKTIVVILNTRKNLEFVITNWDMLAQQPLLCIYFVNPCSETETKWIIYPSTHNRIADRKALKKGLEALFSTVQEIKQ